MELDELIHRIGVLRARANLSARALSLKINMNECYINRLENNKTKFEPSLGTLFSIIEACDSTPEEFFYHNINEFKIDKQTIDLLKKLSHEQKEALMTLLKNK
jgi:transcriptional regulator with XRE-family HTH domain